MTVSFQNSGRGTPNVSKSDIILKTKQERDAAIKTLHALFPSMESFSDFRDNDREISRQAIPCIIRYAAKVHVIETETETAFMAFLQQNHETIVDPHYPEDFTFSDVLETLTGNQSVNALIAQMDKIAGVLGLPAISAPMITRLKQHFVINTPKKRALVRLLAFWLAAKRPDLGWHYDCLLKLPANASGLTRPAQEKAGVTISFHLLGQGEIITPADVAWLKNELACCVDYLRLAGHVHRKLIETIGATSFAIRSIKRSGPPDEPRLYMRAVRNVLAMAHQMAARWLLCPYSSSRKRLIMMIAAGPFAQTDQRILNPPEIQPVSDDPGIYLTDFAHLCAGVADVNVGFQRVTHTDVFGNFHSEAPWSVTYFWPNHYYDYIPCLLEEKMLPLSVTDPSYEDFRRSLLFPELNLSVSFGAIEAMHRFPQSSLMLLEITKVLRARRMIHEADAVIASLLLSNPHHLPARFLRMLIHCNLADMETDFESSGLAFERGIAEGEYLVERHKADSEIWCALGVLHFGRAMKMLRRLRANNKGSGPVIQKSDILEHLDKAGKALLQGLSSSTSGQTMNCLFWLQYTRSFIGLFTIGKTIPEGHSGIALLDNADVFRQSGLRLFKTMGWIRNDTPTADLPSREDFDNIINTSMLTFSRYENAMLGRSYIPYMHYLFALMLWDFTPFLTPLVLRMVLELLAGARLKAQALIKDNICVYQVLASYLPAEQFIARIDRSIHLIKTYVSDADLKKGDGFVISPAKAQKMAKIKLMLLEVDYR
jgi:hypothetical protein